MYKLANPFKYLILYLLRNYISFIKYTISQLCSFILFLISLIKFPCFFRKNRDIVVFSKSYWKIAEIKLLFYIYNTDFKIINISADIYIVSENFKKKMLF